MGLGFGSYERMERKLLRTRNILGENDAVFKENNKIQALQLAASWYGLYDGNGSEVTYTDKADLSILQSELIASKAAVELTVSAISYYKDDVVTANGGPASVTFRSDKLAWLREILEELKDQVKDLEDKSGLGETNGVLPGLFLTKNRACADPVDDICPCDETNTGNFETTI